MHEVLIDPSPERQVLDLRVDGFDDVLVVGRYRYVSIHPSLAMHSHGERIEICYLASGQQTYVVEGERYDLRGGDVFVTFPGERHGTGGFPEDRGALYWVIVNARLQHKRFLDLPAAEGRAMVNRLMNLRRRFHGRAVLRQTLEQVFDAYHHETSDVLWRANLRNLLMRFLLDVLACASRTYPGNLSTPIVAAQQFVISHLNEALSSFRRIPSPPSTRCNGG